jgi:hypothetical protein
MCRCGQRRDEQRTPTQANRKAQPKSRTIAQSFLRHFSCLENPLEITCLIRETLMLPLPVPCALPG